MVILTNNDKSSIKLQYITVDFEDALIQVIKEIFPFDITLIGKIIFKM